MRRLCFTVALCAAVILRCGADDSEEPDVGLALYSFAVAGVFNNFCGATVEYPIGANSVTIEAGVNHFFTFPGREFNRDYIITVNEAAGQNVLVRSIDCQTGRLSASLTDTSATGQMESFQLRLFDDPLVLYCSEGCNASISFTTPAAASPAI